MLIVGNYNFVKYLGEDGVAAYSVACYCLPIAFMMGNAIVQSVQPIVSFAYGHGDSVRMRAATRLAVGTAVGMGLLGMTFLGFEGGIVSSTFLARMPSRSAATACRFSRSPFCSSPSISCS